ncbi:MAG: DUF4124 domain-containing protein [Xanthomonadales bacterium]|nr:DUF4124 domain-containing protein [Xanthomonadales bacterium]
MTRNHRDFTSIGPRPCWGARNVFRAAWRMSSALFPLILLAVAGHARAASVYRCVDAHGHLAYQDTSCAGHAQQTKLDLTGQPLIDANAPRQPASTQASKSGSAHSRRAAVTARKRKSDPPTSWECRAADGEVFYRHSRCPGSVPGDGVVRSRYAEKMSSTHARGRHDAWSRVRVHGEKVSRAEACRRIRSPSAAGRDGHQRDEKVDTYARLTGHDPCHGA